MEVLHKKASTLICKNGLANCILKIFFFNKKERFYHIFKVNLKDRCFMPTKINCREN